MLGTVLQEPKLEPEPYLGLETMLAILTYLFANQILKTIISCTVAPYISRMYSPVLFFL